MKRKKILFYCDSMNNGGTEKATLDLVNNLSSDKYDITVIQLEPDGRYQKELGKFCRLGLKIILNIIGD